MSHMCPTPCCGGWNSERAWNADGEKIRVGTQNRIIKGSLLPSHTSAFHSFVTNFACDGRDASRLSCEHFRFFFSFNLACLFAHLSFFNCFSLYLFYSFICTNISPVNFLFATSFITLCSFPYFLHSSSTFFHHLCILSSLHLFLSCLICFVHWG